jgi:hypothetical protein
MKFLLLPTARAVAAFSPCNGGQSMPDRDKRAKRGLCQGQLFPDRAGLIMYLQYALEDLAEIDKTSAALIEKAIMNLRDSNPQGAARTYLQKLS